MKRQKLKIRNRSTEPGANWSVTAREFVGDNVHDVFAASNKGIIDEVVIDNWFHMEQMDYNRWWFRIGDAVVDVSIDENKQPLVSVKRGVLD